MPRVGPNYTLPEPPFVPQTPISSAAVNSDLSDIADALTGSLARNGAGGMTAVLPLANDGLTFLNDPDTGISRSAANTMSFECGNSEIMEVSPTGVDVTGALTQNGARLIPIGLGPLPWSGLTAPAGWVLCYGQALSRTTYAALWAFAQAEIAAGNTLYGNGDGTTTFTVPDLRGRLTAGKDNMGGTAADRITSAGSGITGTTLGAAGGQQTVTLNSAHIPSLTAVQNGLAVSVGSGGRFIATSPNNMSDVAIQSGSTVAAPVSGLGGWNGVTSLTGSINISASYTNASPSAFGVVQPTIITNYIIFAGV